MPGENQDDGKSHGEAGHRSLNQSQGQTRRADLARRLRWSNQDRPVVRGGQLANGVSDPRSDNAEGKGGR